MSLGSGEAGGELPGLAQLLLLPAHAGPLSFSLVSGVTNNFL